MYLRFHIFKEILSLFIGLPADARRILTFILGMDDTIIISRLSISLQ